MEPVAEDAVPSLSVASHGRHSPSWTVRALRLPFLCIGCVTERLQSDAAPTAIRIFLCNEIASAADSSGAAFPRLFSNECLVVQRLLRALQGIRSHHQSPLVSLSHIWFSRTGDRG